MKKWLIQRDDTKKTILITAKTAELAAEEVANFLSKRPGWQVNHDTNIPRIYFLNKTLKVIIVEWFL